MGRDVSGVRPGFSGMSEKPVFMGCIRIWGQNLKKVIFRVWEMICSGSARDRAYQGFKIPGYLFLETL
jgi:hypothetical protein